MELIEELRVKVDSFVFVLLNINVKNLISNLSVIVANVFGSRRNTLHGLYCFLYKGVLAFPKRHDGLRIGYFLRVLHFQHAASRYLVIAALHFQSDYWLTARELLLDLADYAGYLVVQVGEQVELFLRTGFVLFLCLRYLDVPANHWPV
jgi:hypothetical protein